MTPVTGWNEHDYYRASRAARKAWQATNPQLELGLDAAIKSLLLSKDRGAGLEEADADDGNSPVAVSSSPVLLPLGGRDSHRRHPRTGLDSQTTGPDRLSPEDDGQAQRRSR